MILVMVLLNACSKTEEGKVSQSSPLDQPEPQAKPKQAEIPVALLALNDDKKPKQDDLIGNLFRLGSSLAKSADEIRQEIFGLSAKEQKEIGERLHKKLKSKHGLQEDSTQLARIKRLAAPFQKQMKRKGMPLSFHILTSNTDRIGALRGPRINGFCSIIRGCQDIIGMFIFGGVFHRHPKLKLVCVEADAGWAPHYMYRMDHAYKRHRHWMKGRELGQLPSEYFRENVYMTFQDDWTAFKFRDDCNIRRLMWANDFPHSDATWPRSQEILAEHTADMTEQEKDWILHDNVAELYGLNVA